ncbi:MAG TPA: FkbM family methyltransferase [Parvularculaceae bacterium]|nr:FkbM family methyltransferase [Parvularculaceae bacterium]
MPLDPRLLLIDITPLGGAAATSTLKAAFFGDWRDGALLQVLDGGEGRPALSAGGAPARFIPDDPGAAGKIVEAFRPQIILYRPVADDIAFHRLAMALITEARKKTGAGLALWLMDDWPARLQASDEKTFAELDRDLRALLSSSSANFAISERMAREFSARYGAPFEVAHNGVRARDWSFSRAERAGPVRLRYAGSLAPDTALDSVLETAKAVSSLAAGGLPIVFEGRTQPHWLSKYGATFNRLKAVSMRASAMSTEDYRLWLSDADILLVAYNFDEATRRYLKSSFANKLPETLASGAAVLAYGPDDIETMAYVRASGVAETVCERSPQALEAAIKALAGDKARRRALGEKARAHAIAAFDLDAGRARLRARLAAASSPDAPADYEAKREERVQFEECAFVFEALGAKENAGVMIDVGAHVGGSLLPFARAGWKVFAFEPDKNNRAQLLAASAPFPDVRVSAKAVGALEAEGLAFYRSDVSSGISGLTPFHESHRLADRVDMTTLNRLITDEKIATVDFLKIDVEGHEMDVFDGLDFAKTKPRAIVAEFEDAKTKERGVSMHDLARRLEGEGYVVYVSEWHSVEAYGRKHSWRRLMAYPCETGEGAWGNLVAFIERPDAARFADAFGAALIGGPAGLGARAVAETIGEPPRPRSLYRRMADAIARRSPRLVRMLQPAVRFVRRLTGRPSGGGI